MAEYYLDEFREAADTTVLVVDDEAAQRLLLKETLARDGFTILEAKNGMEAINIVESTKVQLILMDIMMPVMGGLEACARIRATATGADVPIVLITGLDDQVSIKNAFDVDATDFITKPVNWPILSHRVRYLLKADRTLKALKSSEARLSHAQKIAMLGNWEWDIENNQFYGSNQAIEILALKSITTEMDNEAFVNLAHPADRQVIGDALDQSLKQAAPFSVDHRVLSNDGSTRIVHQEAVVIYSPVQVPISMQGTIQDISKRKEAEEKIMHLAFFDTLTGLPNRTNFKNLVSRKIESAQVSKSKLAILFLDLDGFKRVNDTLGHDAGDELLKLIAAILNDCLRSNDSVERLTAETPTSPTLSRLGGDEFTILLGELNDDAQVARVAKRILDHLRQPIKVRDQEVFITGSLGIAVYPDNGKDYEELLKNADIAMYQAKDDGKNGYQFYTAHRNPHTTEKLDLESRLLKASRENEFVLYYQPQVSLATNEIVGMEALLRWQNPATGLVYPNEFVPFLEESGLISQIGEWVLTNACEQMAEWLNAGFQPAHMSVNISGYQFRHHEFFESVKKALDHSGLAANYLVLEMTESIIMQQVDRTINELIELKKLGLSLSIDDFGVGYSSMNYLKRFPLDTLKIDRSFIQNITTSSIDSAIVKATIAMAKSLDLITIAEGVENNAQKEVVLKLGCDCAQGFYYSKPLAADDAEKLLKRCLKNKNKISGK